MSKIFRVPLGTQCDYKLNRLDSPNIPPLAGRGKSTPAISYKASPENKITIIPYSHTVAGRAVSFALEQPLYVVTLACSTSGILK
ncbi:MAG: hypothetical protein LBJ00_06825 [Planctomycetaceae bacterium]|nr:hypothetical protein [Planctomycetaceae bacterium]